MQITKIAPNYKVSFGRTLKEHKSWGARVNPNDDSVSFKFFTYPDVQNASVLIQKKGEKDSAVEIELENKGRGIFERTNVPSKIAHEGDKYQYKFTRKDGTTQIVKDPYSFKQDEVSGPSIIYDQSKYEWKNDKEWKINPERIKRTANGEGKYKSTREARIFALNPDTFTDKRSYEGVIDKLKYIKEMGFNTVELMHIENTFDINWGYDGVDKHAPCAKLGGPDKLKELVDAIHGEGMNVVFDVVPNHFGPDGNQIKRSGPYVKGPNAFGDAVNFEGEDSEYVRDYMVNAMLDWAEFYHVDGLRLDMTKFMESDYTLKQLASEMNYHHPEVFLIAEDGRDHVSIDNNGNYWNNPDEIHDKRVTSPIKPEEYGKGSSQEEHAKKISDIINGKTSLANLGMNSEWDFALYHQINEALYDPEVEGLMKAILCSQDNVKYIDSHDEIGNFDGTRKIAKLINTKLRMDDSVVLNNTDIERAKKYAQKKNQSFEDALHTVTCQKAQLISEALATKLQTGELDKYETPSDTSYDERKVQREKFKEEVLIPLGVNPKSRISIGKLQRAFTEACGQYKMASALVYAIPGAKMVFQGCENLDMTPFRFFRKFESVPYEDYLYVEKGYEPAEKALEASTLGKIEYSKEGASKMEKFALLSKDLNKINNENKALRLGYIDDKTLVEHHMSKVIGFNSKYADNEIFTVTNFSDVNYREDKENEYYIPFPKGKWVEILNTNDEKYGGDGRHNNPETISGDGSTNQPINLSKYSTIYFKRIA